MLGISSFLLVTTVVVNARRNHKNILKTLELGFANQKLIEDLRQEQSKTQKANEGLKEEIRRRIETEKELIQAKEKAEEYSRIKTQFLANTSHELRTPMNAVIGLTELLLHEDQVQGETRENLSLISRAADNLVGVINQVLDFSRIEARELHLEVSDFDLALELDKLEAHFRMRALERKQELVVHRDLGPPQTHRGDAGRLVQILGALLDNAMKFSPEAAPVELSLTLKPQGRAKVLLEAQVKDRGTGIDPELLPHIFESFRQADGSSTRRFGGLGLGLSVAHRLVDLMEGQIQASSTPGQGSCFLVTLPLQVVQKPQEVTTSFQRPDLSAYRLLMVEDDLNNQQLLLKILKKSGAAVEVANHGEEALEALARSRFDLVLMDLQMPVMDGLTATQKIRQGQAGVLQTTIPVIAVTANADSKDRLACQAVGMDGFVAKPIQMTQLFGQICRLLGL